MFGNTKMIDKAVNQYKQRVNQYLGGKDSL